MATLASWELKNETYWTKVNLYSTGCPFSIITFVPSPRTTAQSVLLYVLVRVSKKSRVLPLEKCFSFLTNKSSCEKKSGASNEQKIM